MCGVRERIWFLKNCGTLSRGFGLRSFRPKLTNLNILRIGKSVFVFEFVFVFVEWAFTVNLRPKKTPQAEISGGISGRKLLRPKPLESVPPQFLPLPPSPSNKAGWAYRSKLLRDNYIIYTGMIGWDKIPKERKERKDYKKLTSKKHYVPFAPP